MYPASFNWIAGMMQQKYDFLITFGVIAAQIFTFCLLGMQFEAEFKITFPVIRRQQFYSFSEIR
ncbi:hypothetical protein D3C78_549510 [compost metagenome]